MGAGVLTARERAAQDEDRSQERHARRSPNGEGELPYNSIYSVKRVFHADACLEFPGCIATGETASEALANLENVAASWLEATLARGQRIPEPIENVGFSGKLVVRLPKTLHKKAAHMAARDGISLNQFIVSSVAERVGGRSSSAPVGQVQTSPVFVGSLFYAPIAFQSLYPPFAAGMQQVLASSSGNPVIMERVDARN